MFNFRILTAATLVFAASCSHPEKLSPRDEGVRAVTAALNKALDLQRTEDLEWNDAISQALKRSPGGPWVMAWAGDAIIYQSDDICVGGWIGEYEKPKVTDCDSIEWPSDRIDPATGSEYP